MTIRPIDIQTNVAQMLEVGKNEQAKQAALAEQQHILDKKAREKSNLADSKLEELKEGDKTAIRDEDKKGDRRERKGKEKGDKRVPHETGTEYKDDRMGRIIDIFK